MSLESNRILLIGGAGFIGSSTAVRLIEKGHFVRILDSFDPQIHGENLKASATLQSVWKGAEIQVGDVRDPGAVERALRGIDTIYYFAAGTGTGQSMYQIRQYTDTNVNGAAILAEQLIKKRSDIRRIIVSSSRAVYGEGAYVCLNHGTVFPGKRSVEAMQHGQFEPTCCICGRVLDPILSSEEHPVQPTSIYGLTKYAQEQLLIGICSAVGIPSVALRYQNVYGPGQSLSNPYTGILSIFSQLILQGSEINLFEDGLATRDFVYIDDVVECNVTAGFSLIDSGSIFNVGTSKRQSLIQVVTALSAALNRNANFRISGQFRIGDIRHAGANNEKLSQILGFDSFVNFRDGIERFAAWVGNQKPNHSVTKNYAGSLAEMSESGILKGHS
jgi:dTDP-L-rhamnose 4-epimerase